MNIKVDEYLQSEKFKKGKASKRRQIRESGTNQDFWDDPGKERGLCRTITTDSLSIQTEREPPKDYEEMIQKYEADIWNHIKIEQQMKLHSDSVIDKLEDKEKEVSKLEKKIKEYEQKLWEVEEHWKLESRAKDEENSALKRALENKID